MSGRVLIGTSGWSYPRWRGSFYPSALPQDAWLGYLAERTTSTEVNASFYRLQRPTTYQQWYQRTPPGHVLAVKGGRYLTHLKRLRDPETGMTNFFSSGVSLLGDKLGPVLWQLPADLALDVTLLRDFLQLLPSGAAPGKVRWRHALEPRHPSFADDAVYELLAEHGVATVRADSARRWPELDADTADFRYVRLHGHSELYASRYADRTLDTWAQRCAAWTAAGQDVHVYFDNDARGHAPHDAVRLLERLGSTTPIVYNSG